MAQTLIRLVGPGGAGKSTAGTLLAERLGVPFIDLDRQFALAAGDISQFISEHGYHAYAARNVRLYVDLSRENEDRAAVLALSSGFMTYPDDIHRHYAAHKQHIAAAPTTFVLLPSLDLDTCVAEIVRRQRGRPFTRSAEREEQVIRARFPVYVDLPAAKIETMRPPARVVDAMLSAPSLRRADA